jgi:hypothetical protein
MLTTVRNGGDSLLVISTLGCDISNKLRDLHEGETYSVPKRNSVAGAEAMLVVGSIAGTLGRRRGEAGCYRSPHPAPSAETPTCEKVLVQPQAHHHA